ncbi:AAA family ATPase [Microbacterium sp.]|uniref:AAA family ATPase n=1 Tax=Microbacterium sp. TaxID=51671 RepID=UPI0039E28446
MAVAGAPARRLVAALREEDADVRAVVAAGAPAAAVADAMSGPEAAELLAELSRADLLVLDADRATLTADLVGACDRFGVRIAPLCAREADRRLAALFGLTPAEPDAARLLRPEVMPTPVSESPRGRVIVVWGADGAPGRTTVAVELACELARDGRRVALVDADSRAPSIAIATGLADEGPGFAAACRQAERGGLSPAELTRIAVPLGELEVLTGINRPGRWPELGHARVAAALEACRPWVDDVVVDVAAALERDEEIVSDLDGPRRNAATLAALAVADLVVAVVAADPVGVSRFVRAYPELRAAAGAASVHVVVNKTRRGALGIDAHGQVRRTLERFAGIDDVSFLPWDGKATDAAMLTARPVAHTSPRSALTAAVRRFVGEIVEPPSPTGRRERRRAAHIPRTA